MTWSPKSLKQALFLWLVLPLLLLIFINAFFSYKNAVDAANDAYDRSLYIAARTVAEELRFVDGELKVEVPQSATYLFENNIGGQELHSGVRWRLNGVRSISLQLLG